jgi:hypothetical protein
MSRKLKFNAAPELIQLVAEVRQSANSQFRIQVNRRYGHTYVTLSLWFRKRGGDWWRRSAHHFTPDELDAVLPALRLAGSAARIAQDVPEPPTLGAGAGE